MEEIAPWVSIAEAQLPSQLILKLGRAPPPPLSSSQGLPLEELLAHLAVCALRS